jgi:YVTN family beta-propeller protein
MTGVRARLAPALAALIVMSCSISLGSEPLTTPAPEPIARPDASPEPLPTPSATPAPTPAATAAPRYSKLRVFVASESTNQVWVLEGTPPRGSFALVARIPVGTLPHQMAISPDGKWVAVNNRLADSTSIIDPIAMKEVVRIRVGKQPHGITFSPDSRTLYVAHERDTYILPIEVGTWRPQTPLVVGVPQHVLLLGTKRPNDLYFTLTNTSQLDHLRVFDLVSRRVTNIKVSDVHDAYYTPDQSEVWSSSSGFIDKPSDRMVIYDPDTKQVKEEIHLRGHYPFHTEKENQDGVYFLQDRSIMVLSDHLGPGLMWLDWKTRTILGETFLGKQPFHSTYDPDGDRLLVTTNEDGMVNVIDVKTRQVMQKVPVTKPHGIAAVGIPQP